MEDKKSAYLKPCKRMAVGVNLHEPNNPLSMTSNDLICEIIERFGRATKVAGRAITERTITLFLLWRARKNKFTIGNRVITMTDALSDKLTELVLVSTQ
ncbi:MAG: hypothetical protein GEU26_04625 [Nitrososphaeraceae archaeon]|nr:hypothetical protein [Nitrososphaeraceae archaeon]